MAIFTCIILRVLNLDIILAFKPKCGLTLSLKKEVLKCLELTNQRSVKEKRSTALERE
jgi:hypothetical protein